MAEESRLVIVIDARNAEKTAKALNDELKKLQGGGDTASNAIKKVGSEAENQTGKISQLKTSLSNLAKETSVYMAGLAGTVVGSLGALAALAVQYSNTAAEIEKFAYLSGTTTTQFQEWAVGARLMGVEVEKLSDIFKDTRDRIGDFVAFGSGEMADFFTEIAVKTEGGTEGALKLAKAMKDLSGADALMLYVEKLEEAGVSTNEMVTYMEKVADEATLLIPLLENGGEGFRLWAEAAQNAGAIMDDETLAAAHRLKVESELLMMQVDGLKNQFMSALLPALNQIASAFLDTSEQGVQWRGVAQGVADTMIWLAKVGMGVAATFDVIGTAIGGSVAAMTNKNVTHQMVLDDLAKKVDSYGTKLNKLGDPTAQNKMVDALVKVQQRANASANAVARGTTNTKNMQKAFDDAAGSSKKAKDNTEQLRREAERAAREVQRIVFDYSSGDKQKELKLADEIDRLQKYGQTQYIQIAKNRFNEEAKLSKMKFEYDLVEHRLNEEKKLRFTYNIKEQEINADRKLTAEQIKLKQEALKSSFEEELSQIKLTQKQRMLSANESLMSEEQRIIERYKLEREEIAKTKDAEERKALLSAKDRTFVSGGVNPIDGEYFKNSPYKEMFKTNVQVLQEGYIKEAELMAQRHQEAREQAILNNEDFLEIDKAYFESRAQMQAEYDKKFSFAKQNDWMSSFQNTASIVGDVSNSWGRLTEAVRQTSGEQSKEYRKMFEIQKKFAMISAVVNGALAVSQVWADPSLNFYMKIGASIATGVATAAEVALISSQQPQGFKTGGYTGNAGTSQVAGVVHGQEYVLNAEATKRVGVGTLDAINNGGNLPQQAQTVSGGDVNLKMINVVDPKMVGDFMNTADGEKVMLNFIRNNKSEVARIVR